MEARGFDGVTLRHVAGVSQSTVRRCFDAEGRVTPWDEHDVPIGAPARVFVQNPG